MAPLPAPSVSPTPINHPESNTQTTGITLVSDDPLISYCLKPNPLPETTILSLCRRVTALLLEESNLPPLNSPISIAGDLHGQFYDLLELLRRGGGLPSLDRKYVFMGDFVDRGLYSLETLQLLMALKVRFPESVSLLRGNHESRQITQVYGFYDECQQKYGNSAVWKACCNVFDYLPLGAIIDSQILCVHGGLSPDVKTLDQVRTIARAQEIPHEGAFCDIMWSDPDDTFESSPSAGGWGVSPRGAGWLFGGRVTAEFEHLNGLTLIARAHQLVQEGFKHMFDNRLVTVWSAPNYCYRCGNLASLMTVTETGETVFKTFDAAIENETDERNPATRRGGGGVPNYFV